MTLVTKEIEALAQAARPLNDDEWGSDRQLEAENAFVNATRELMHPIAWEEFIDATLKCTTDEMVDYALKLLREE
jgi:hypothetical protein